MLAEVGGGHWQPDRDSRHWMRFTLKAHLHQAQLLVRRIQESENLWGRLESLVALHGLPDRSLVALFDASMRMRVRNATYRAAFKDMGEAISEGMAGRDLRQLVDAGLLTSHGEKRGRFYRAAEPLKAARRAVIEHRDPSLFADPFAI